MKPPSSAMFGSNTPAIALTRGVVQPDDRPETRLRKSRPSCQAIHEATSLARRHDLLLSKDRLAARGSVVSRGRVAGQRLKQSVQLSVEMWRQVVVRHGEGCYCCVALR